VHVYCFKKQWLAISMSSKKPPKLTLWIPTRKSN